MQQDIRHWRTGAVLYSAEAPTFARAVEMAVRDGADLAGADLRHANLINAELDDGLFRGARFGGANLMGANLTAILADGADFTDAALHGACLCESSLRGCDFTGAAFGATDIAGAALDGSRFSTWSAFSLNFVDAASLHGCLYLAEGAAISPFSRPPVVVAGLSRPVVLLGRHAIVGMAHIAPGVLPEGLDATEQALVRLLRDRQQGDGRAADVARETN